MIVPVAVAATARALLVLVQFVVAVFAGVEDAVTALRALPYIAHSSQSAYRFVTAQ